MVKNCAFCGEEFTPRTSTQKYCEREHSYACSVCGQEVIVLPKRYDVLRRMPACSEKCRQKKAKQTMMRKYGTLAPGSSEEARAKSANTMKSRYGAAYTLQCPELAKKAADTIMARYGVQNVAGLSQTLQKRESTCLAKYGVVSNLCRPLEQYNARKSTEVSLGVMYPFQSNMIQARATAGRKYDDEGRYIKRVRTSMLNYIREHQINLSAISHAASSLQVRQFLADSHIEFIEHFQVN